MPLLAPFDALFVSQVTADAMGWMVYATASEGGGETTARSRVASAAPTANVEDRRVGNASTDRARVSRASVVRRASLAPRACMASTAAWAARGRRAQVCSQLRLSESLVFVLLVLFPFGFVGTVAIKICLFRCSRCGAYATCRYR